VKNNTKKCVITVHGSDDSVAFNYANDFVLLFQCQRDNFRTVALENFREHASGQLLESF